MVLYRIKNQSGQVIADVYNKTMAKRFRERGYRVEIWRYSEKVSKWKKYIERERL